MLILASLLTGTCQVKDPDLMTTMELNSDWIFRKVGMTDWMNATVPGTVHSELIENKDIEDPFYRLNEYEVQWIDKVDWEYRPILFWTDLCWNATGLHSILKD